MLAVAALAGVAFSSQAQEPVFATEACPCQGADIALRILEPDDERTGRPAIVLFHGGGWSEGEAAWMDGLAARFVEHGLVALSVDYRLSRDGVTPFDAVADSRNAIRWVRDNADRLGIDPTRVAALGTSAGAHLAASAAVFDERWGNATSGAPDLLVLRSPAIAVADSTWFQRLAGGTAQAAALSPDLHVRAGLPPMLLLQGDADNVTPAAGARTFCQRVEQAGGTCELELYPGVGHLFTRNLEQQEIPDYSAIDRDVSRDASEKTIAFLARHDFFDP